MHLVNWVLVLVSCIQYLYVVRANPATLPPPHSPTKVVAAAAIKSEKLRYYSFHHEDEANNHRGSSSGQPHWGKGGSGSAGRSSGDPFELPSLTDIADIMRRRDSESQSPGSDEHHHQNKHGDGWGWPKETRPTRPRPTKGWGWSHTETTTWAPPPSQGPNYGWSSHGDGGSRYGLGSYGMDRKDDSSRYWSYGWYDKTTTPKYRPNYLASDEEKYKPIRYPSSSIIGSGGRDSGYGRPSSSLWSSAAAGQSKGYGQGSQSSSWPSSSQPGQSSLSWGQSSPSWSSGSGSSKGHESHYQTESNYNYRPHSGGSSWPVRDDPIPGWGWPKPEPVRPPRPPPTTKGWSWSEPTRPPRPPPTSKGWGWPEPTRRPRPPPTTQGWGWPEPTRPPRPPPTSKGWGWPEPTRRPRPPPTTQGWGWSQESFDKNKQPNTPQGPNRFEYTPGKDDLTNNIPPDIYERPDYPPGISHSKGSPDSNSYNSREDGDFPNQPNHYRIVAYTPSPEEIAEIARRPPVGGGSPPSQDDSPGWAPSFGNNKSQGPPPPQGPPPQSNNNSNKGQKGKNNKGSNPRPGPESDENPDKWFTKNDFKRIRTTTAQPHQKARPRPRPTAQSRPFQFKGDVPQNHDKQDRQPSRPVSKSNSRPSTSGNSNSEQNAMIEGTNNKGSSKRTRYDEHGFKYIPFNHPNPMARSLKNSQRDIYENLDYTNAGEKVDSSDRIEEASESRHWTQALRAQVWSRLDPTEGLEPDNSRPDFEPRLEDGNPDDFIREALDERLESAAIDPADKNSNPCPLRQMYSKERGQCEEPPKMSDQSTTMKSIINLFK